MTSTKCPFHESTTVPPPPPALSEKLPRKGLAHLHHNAAVRQLEKEASSRKDEVKMTAYTDFAKKLQHLYRNDRARPDVKLHVVARADIVLGIVPVAGGRAPEKAALDERKDPCTKYQGRIYEHAALGDKKRNEEERRTDIAC